jgi:hypothetical protein
MQTLDALSSKALGHRLQRDWDAAVATQSERIALAQTLDDVTLTAIAMNELAEVYRQMTHLDTAADLAECALALVRKAKAELGEARPLRRCRARVC